MQANACVVALEKLSLVSLVTAVERALALCKGTVYVDLRQVQTPSVSTLNVIGKVYGSVARVAPQRDVVPLLNTSYTSGDIESLPDVEKLFLVREREMTNSLDVTVCSAGDSPVKVLSWPIEELAPNLVTRETVTIPPITSDCVSYKNVALGGTFDRLHAGHRLLLTVAAAVSSENIYVGVADKKLLEGKRLKGLIQDFDQRVMNVTRFLKTVKPSLEPVIMKLEDPDVPTRAEADPDMDALIVSEETLRGGIKINQGRVKRNFAKLVTIVVPVLGAMSEGEKLSSTALREADLNSI